MISTVHIFGLGAAGSNLLSHLIRVYPDLQYIGCDFDKVEERNLRTQAYFTEHLGQPKALAMMAVLARRVRKPKYIPINRRIEQVDRILNPESSLLIDCFDNKASRTILAECGYPHVLHVGFSPEFAGEIIWSPDYDSPDDLEETAADICTMNRAGPFLQLVTGVAAMAVIDFIDDEKKNDYIVTGSFRVKQL